jgi:2,3-diketo-5-methylthio-1-phosphopentane phosphatase
VSFKTCGDFDMPVAERVLVSDFDGTITKHDFYQQVVDRLLKPVDIEPWSLYTSGKLSHFDALARIFSKIRASEDQMEDVLTHLELDVGFAESIHNLQHAGWEIVVVSNGCRWYIDRMLARLNLQLQVYSNPGRYTPTHGLQLSRPTDSPFYCEETGIDKALVVRHFLREAKQVAFAGDGRPDLRPALLVPEKLRFAKSWLANQLEAIHENYRRFENWSEIADHLISHG